MAAYPKTDYKLASKLNKASWVLTAIVLLLVGLMRRIKFDLGVDFSFLPPISAGLNTLVAILLLVALYFVKQGNIDRHRQSIFGAMVASALFLVCYVLYHFTTEETRYCGEGIPRTVYYFFLITHIVLAGISLPFILFTFVRGLTYQVALHKSMARWVFPLWLYVAVTGPIVYLMLKSCY
jgi:putative membrane protein